MKKKIFNKISIILLCTLIVWIILLICMLLMDFHIISDTEPNAIMYAVIIFGMINSIVQILRKE